MLVSGFHPSLVFVSSQDLLTQKNIDSDSTFKNIHLYFDAPSLNAIHEETGLMAVPLSHSPTIVTLKGITPTMETIKHKERKHQRVQQCLRVKQPSLSSPSFLLLLSLNNQCNLPAYFPST